MTLIRLYREWSSRSWDNNDQWCWKHGVQARAMRQAKNIRAQLEEHMDKGVDWDEIRGLFEELRKQRKEIFKQLKYEADQGIQSRLVRRALAEGFFMNTCRKAGQLKAQESGTTYLTVNEGLLVKVDRSPQSSVFALYDYYPDWLVYTDISGGGSVSGGNGLIRMALEVEIAWIEDKMQRLKEIEVEKLCGIKPKEEVT